MAIEPNKMTNRTRQALETKRKIFNTALELFAQYGYDTVTVDDIAKRSGHSKGTFYANFPTKDSVLLEQFNLIDAHYEHVFSTVEEDMCGIDRILLLFNATFDYCANVVGVAPLRVVYSSQISSPDSARILNNQDRLLYKIMRESVDRAKLEGDLPLDHSTQQLTDDLLRISRGLIYDWCMYGNDFNLQVEGNRTFAHMLKLLKMEAKSGL